VTPLLLTADTFGILFTVTLDAVTVCAIESFIRSAKALPSNTVFQALLIFLSHPISRNSLFSTAR
jgi:hypothetical protein